MKRIDQPELLDNLNESITAAELAKNLTDLARINELLGTRLVISQTVWTLIESIPPQPELIRVIDVGAGTGDFLALLSIQAERQGKSIQTLALEHDPAILTCLRQSAPGQSAIGGDALRLPLASHSVDVVICAQMLHHLTPAQVVHALQEFRRIAKYGVILFDLDRSYLALIGAFLLTRLLSRNRLTRHDGVLSVRRAYHPVEVQEMLTQIAADQAVKWRFYPVFPFRWLAVYAVDAR